ncbi:hypothetical protein [uncultured Aquincola sp.]|uniref:hypothetical protein n=1 Tax=uncultured Aquincola sp. TaxID=886556 RepID=UPI0032B12BCB|tara:strand:+ start:4245 stop:5168 length:924 start_codon:yes stop_codon:yes gene_type:complete
MTATTPPKSHQRLAQVQSQDVDDIVLRAAYLRTIPVLKTPAAALDLSALDADTLAIADEWKDLDAETLRGLLAWDLARHRPVHQTGTGWTALGLDAWSLDWTVDGKAVASAGGQSRQKSEFDEAVGKVQLDPSRLLEAALHASEPQVGLLVMLGALSAKPDAIRHTVAVVDALTSVTMLVVNRLKRGMNVPRPGDWDKGQPVVPLLPVPATTSYPGGHAAVLAALQVLLPALAKLDAAQTGQLETLARELTKDRVRMGLHTELDSTAGEVVGKALGNALLRLATDATVKKSCPLWAAAFALAQREWK